mgnify:CR=1 FL=1
MKNESQYNSLFVSFKKEIYSLEEKVSKLEKENLNLKYKILELTKNRDYLIKLDNNNKILAEEQKKRLDRIKDLENEILKLTESSKEENRNLKKDLEREISYYKGLNDTGSSKILAAESIMKLNETQHNYIIKLEEEISTMKKENAIKMEQMQIDHERHYIKLKKQMMDYMKKAQDEMSKNNTENLELNMNFGLLYKNQMLNELESQSLQIEELLKIKEKQERKIYILEQEVETHKKVEQLISQKKDEYLKLAKKRNTTLENKIIHPIPLMNSDNNNTCLTFRNAYNKDKFRNMNKKDYNDYISLEKTYKELLEENRFIKNKYNTLKDKDKMFQNKFKGIINLYNGALEKIIKDDKIKQKENIYINIKDLKNGDYEKFTKEEKYFILVSLINNLLPLININEGDEQLSSLKDKINSIEYRMNKTEINKYADLNRDIKVKKPIFRIPSKNFFSLITNDDSNANSNEGQQFVSIFGDDFVQYKKSIYTESNLNSERINFQRILKNKKYHFRNKNSGVSFKNKTFTNFKSENFKGKIENLNSQQYLKNIINKKKRDSYDKKIVRQIAI